MGRMRVEVKVFGVSIIVLIFNGAVFDKDFRYFFISGRFIK